MRFLPRLIAAVAAFACAAQPAFAAGPPAASPAPPLPLNLTLIPRALDFKLVDLQGDSRTAQSYVSTIGTSPNFTSVATSGNSWFNVMNAMLGHAFQINYNTAVSGYRTDQWIKVGHPVIAASNAGTVLSAFGSAVNDISQAQPVTLTASISNGLMSVTALSGGAVNIGAVLSGVGVTSAAVISQASGTTGGVGTYNISVPQTVSSGTIISTGYTDVNGNYVSLSNVAAVAEANILAEVKSVLAQGKKYVLALEPGSVNLVAASVQAMNEFNIRLRSDLATRPGVYLLNFNTVVHSPTASSSILGFRTGCLYDGATHYNAFCAFYQAKVAKPIFAALLPPNVNFGPSNLTDAVTTNPRQLVNNALFSSAYGTLTFTASVSAATSATLASNWGPASGVYSVQFSDGSTRAVTLTNGATTATWSGAVMSASATASYGGTISGSGTLTSGMVPVGWTLKLPLSTTACVSTPAAETWSPSYLLTGLSLGNMVTLNCTVTAADSVSLIASAPSTSLYTATDLLQGGVNAHVAAGSTNAAIYSDLQMNYNNSGGNTSYDAYGNYVAAPYTGMTLPNDAYDYLLENEIQSFPASTTSVGYLSLRVIMFFSAAGNMTASLYEPVINRYYTPNP